MKALTLSPLLVAALCPLLSAQPKCSNASLNGTLFFAIGGSIKQANATVSYAEQGWVIADGAGNFTNGSTTTSTAGTINTLAVTGTYSVNGNCSGTGTLTTTNQSVTFALQIVNGGALTLTSVTSDLNNELGQMRLYRAANATGSICGNGSATGAYGLLLSGGTYSGGVRTPYETEAQITFDGNGNVTAYSGEVTSSSQTGQTNFAGTGTYTIAANCSGTVQLTLNNTVQLNYNIARTNGSILFLETDSSTTVSGSAQAQQLTSVLPQFVFGAGTWYSALYFANATSTTISFPVSFFSDTSTTLTVPGVGTTKNITLGPNSTAIIEAPNTGTFGSGWAQFALPAGVSGHGVFRQTVAGRADQEALVGFKGTDATANSLIYDDTNNYITTVAILNPSQVPTTVTITCYDNAGNVLGTSMQALPAGSKIASQLDQFANLGGIIGKRGYATFTVPNGSVAVLGLRFGGVAFTSIPVAVVQ
jgi:hypothetical protein